MHANQPSSGSTHCRLGALVLLCLLAHGGLGLGVHGADPLDVLVGHVQLRAQGHLAAGLVARGRVERHLGVVQALLEARLQPA